MSEKIGRPSIYSQELADKICERLMLGESLRKICGDEGMPEKRTVCYWLRDKEDFFHQYARAREVQMELMAEEIMDISDDDSGDTMTITGPDGKLRDIENKEFTSRAKLRVDTRKWIMSKLATKRFGDKQEVNVNQTNLPPPSWVNE